ncbi:hypothetical protein I3843_01G165900 [Carya illinoinensis]|nr:hypothetical protein I3843_01G165900 [Carya illinoinensis]
MTGWKGFGGWNLLLLLNVSSPVVGMTLNTGKLLYSIVVEFISTFGSTRFFPPKAPPITAGLMIGEDGMKPSCSSLLSWSI